MYPCDQCSDLLLDYLYGLLDEGAAQVLRDHLTSCPACRTALTEAETQQNLIARAAQVYAEVPPFSAPTSETTETTEAPASAEPEAPDAVAPPAAEAPPATLPLPPPARRRRRWAWVSAAAGILLAALGVYGVVSYREGLARR